MKEEIEVGEFVRTEFGIGKVKNITIEPEVDIGLGIMPEVEAYWINEHEYFEKDDITKHSHNLIDLIEKDDYVNGYKVISVDYDVLDKHTECIELDLNNNYQYNFISIEQIKSIVTKEQFASMQYNVEE